MSADPWVWLLGAALLLTLPLPWLAAAALAAAVHEGCHILCALALGGKVGRLTVGTAGAALESWFPTPGRELVCALAGPLGSFCLAPLFRLFPRLAVCGLVQGAFNLLPVYPLDGGRALRCALTMIFPRHAPAVAGWVEGAALLALAGLALMALGLGLGMAPALVALGLAAKGLARKKSCKPPRFRVQ